MSLVPDKAGKEFTDMEMRNKVHWFSVKGTDFHSPHLKCVMHRVETGMYNVPTHI